MFNISKRAGIIDVPKNMSRNINGILQEMLNNDPSNIFGKSFDVPIDISGTKYDSRYSKEHIDSAIEDFNSNITIKIERGKTGAEYNASDRSIEISMTDMPYSIDQIIDHELTHFMQHFIQQIVMHADISGKTDLSERAKKIMIELSKLNNDIAFNGPTKELMRKKRILIKQFRKLRELQKVDVLFGLPNKYNPDTYHTYDEVRDELHAIDEQIKIHGLTDELKEEKNRLLKEYSRLHKLSDDEFYANITSSWSTLKMALEDEYFSPVEKRMFSEFKDPKALNVEQVRKLFEHRFRSLYDLSYNVKSKHSSIAQTFLEEDIVKYKKFIKIMYTEYLKMVDEIIRGGIEKVSSVSKRAHNISKVSAFNSVGLVKLYELEKEFRNPGTNSARQNRIEKDMLRVLADGIFAFKVAFEEWFDGHMLNIKKFMSTDSREKELKWLENKHIEMTNCSSDEARQKAEEYAHGIIKTYEKIKNVYDRYLKNGPSMDVNKDWIAFHAALQTGHFSGPILNYVNKHIDSPDRKLSNELLTDLTSGEYWDRRSSVRAISRRSKKRPPKKWFNKMRKEIKKNSPDYDDERVSVTIGDIWYHNLTEKKRKQISKRDRKALLEIIMLSKRAKTVDDEEMLELFAEQAHTSWAGWTKYMLEKLDGDDKQDHINRWLKQIDTPYKDLSEKEKESDRVEARAYIALLEDE